MQDNRQQTIRDKLNLFITQRGVKATWVCQQCGGLDTSLISRYRTGKRDLWEDTLNKLEEFLNNNN